MIRYMNGVARALYSIPNGYIKLGFVKIFKGLKFGELPRIDLHTEISIERKTKCIIGKRFNMRGNSILRVRKAGVIVFGNNVSLANNCIVVCHERIEIGNNVQLSPGVLMYDHDHDYKAINGLKNNKFKTSPIIIGNNVWVGANSIILRGAIIGDNCVIAAGTVVKAGKYPSNSLIYNNKEIIIKSISN